ncbi:tRNA (guanosine(37)-N1)-methyltransferase TrmD [Candidatus Latescibacterota bacterium]
MNVYILTIFPDIFDSFLRYGIVKRAIDKKLLNVIKINIRDAARDKHKTIDDTPYGGGAGMIMKPDILTASLKSTVPFIEKRKTEVLLLTPQGKRFDQPMANMLSMQNEFILVCGRYRGVDERFRELYVTEELSIGDYVLSGGEPAAMVVIDAVARLIPGVLHDFESGIEDSFQNGLLDCLWYTRPEVFEGLRVPETLLSGNHAEIKKWRYGQSIERTKKRRPDLLKDNEK